MVSKTARLELRKNNPFAKKKASFGCKKHRFFIKKPDIGKGILQKGEQSDSGEKRKQVLRSALVKQHDSAILLNYKLATEKDLMHEKEEYAGGKKKHVA